MTQRLLVVVRPFQLSSNLAQSLHNFVCYMHITMPHICAMLVVAMWPKNTQLHEVQPFYLQDVVHLMLHNESKPSWVVGALNSHSIFWHNFLDQACKASRNHASCGIFSSILTPLKFGVLLATFTRQSHEGCKLCMACPNEDNAYLFWNYTFGPSL